MSIPAGIVCWDYPEQTVPERICAPVGHPAAIMRLEGVMRALGIVRTLEDDLNRETSFPIGAFHGSIEENEIPDPAFDPGDDKFRHAVLVRIMAFSCNFRDIAVIHRFLRSDTKNPFILFGSDFVGTVTAVGKDVERLEAGDTVIEDNSYPVAAGPHASPGVPSNHVSCEYIVLASSKLTRIPKDFPLHQAAAFSLNAQTVQSMIRRLDLAPRSDVLITAGRSNVAIFTLRELARLGHSCTVLTTSTKTADRILDLGARDVVIVEHVEESETSEEYGRILAGGGQSGYAAVIDPFSDIYLHRVLKFLRTGGKYITCGIANQIPGASGETAITGPHALQQIQGIAIVNNLEIYGNCLGSPEDLQRAIASCRSRTDPVIMDSVFHEGREVDFFRRTFFDKDRFGKVVFDLAPIENRP